MNHQSLYTAVELDMCSVCLYNNNIILDLLIFLDPPVQPTVNTSSIMPVYLTINNYNLSLECVTVDIPNSGYKWEKAGDPLQRMEGENSSQMTIKNLKPEDSGDYRCIVSNSTGAIESRYKKIEAKGNCLFT